MPVIHLPCFSVFEATDFHIGGDLGLIEDTETDWLRSARGLQDEHDNLAAVDFSGYLGSEGEGLSELTNVVYASRVGSAAQAVRSNGQAINGYSQDYAQIKSEMDTLIGVAIGHHTAVNLAVDAVNAAEISLGAAIASGNPVAITAAQTHLTSCEVAHAEALATWNADLTTAANIKITLGGFVDSRVGEVGAIHTSYHTGAAEFGGGAGTSDSWQVTESCLTHAASTIEDIADHVESYGAKLTPLAGADEVHGMRLVTAIDTQCENWKQECIKLADKLRELASGIRDILDLIKQWDLDAAERSKKVQDLIQKMVEDFTGFIFKYIFKGDFQAFKDHFTPKTFDLLLPALERYLQVPIDLAAKEAKNIPSTVVDTAKKVDWTKAPKALGRGLPAVGAVLGSAADIKQGVNPALAVGSNAAGAAAGVALGAKAGAAIGSVIPGAGTVAGFLIGAGVGFIVTKGIQWAAK